ncbi:MAG: serine hydrolase [Anaerolineae bacterium]
MSFIQFEKFLHEKIAETKLPGLSAAIVKAGEVIWSRGFGYRDAERGLAATPHSVYSIGSVSKSFTVAAILQLAEQGKLSVDDPIDQFMPFPIQPHGEKVCIRHFMSHTSGIPALGYAEALIGHVIGAEANWFPIATAEDILTFMQDAGSWVLNKPGERWYYLNEGYMLLGYIVEKVSGLRFETYVRQHILEPLGMTRTYYNRADVEKDPDVATPYVNWAEQGRVSSQYPWGGIAAAGGILSSVIDLAKYIAMFLKRGSPILSEDSYRAMSTPHIQLPLQNTRFGEETYGYGLSMKSDFFGHQVVGHGGSVGVSTAQMMFIPTQNLGIAILANGSGYATDKFALYGLALALGEDPEALAYVQRERLLKELEGSYATYKNTMRFEIKRAGDLLAVTEKNKYGTNTVLLIPESLEAATRRFYLMIDGSKFPAEFRINGDQIDLVYGRYLFRRTGK